MPSDEIAVVEEANNSNSTNEKKIDLGASNSNRSSRRNSHAPEVVDDAVFGHVGEKGPNYRSVCSPLCHDL